MSKVISQKFKQWSSLPRLVSFFQKLGSTKIVISSQSDHFSDRIFQFIHKCFYTETLLFHCNFLDFLVYRPIWHIALPKVVYITFINHKMDGSFSTCFPEELRFPLHEIYLE